MNWIGFLIIFFGSINLLRMTMFLVGSDIYGLVFHLRNRKSAAQFTLPKFSVVIPAHNEQKTIIRNLDSIYANNYPKSKLQVIFVDDGSTDPTLSLVKAYKKKNHLKNLRIVAQVNSGKASALNRALKLYTKGELVMCLDADSYINNDALRCAARYFLDKKVVALASNVKIIGGEGLLNLIQRFEYLICYQMKRGQTIFNIEYIIGGIGSTFKYSTLKKVGFYDGNTVTEDIDLTMKILRNGNKTQKVIYGANVIAHTEAAIDIKGLISQRYRWKYGRTQTFYKNKNMFFNMDKKYTKLLTAIYLPMAIFFDISFFFEPLFVGYILYLIVRYGDLTTLLSAFLVITSYIVINIFAEESIKLREKFILFLIAPTMYILFYVLSYVEYVALLKALINLKDLKKSLTNNKSAWTHIERAGKKVRVA